MRTMVLRGFSLLHFAQTWQCCLKSIIILKPKQKSEIVDIRASGAEKEIVPETDVIPDKTQRKQGKKWKHCSRLFILLRQKKPLSNDELTRIIHQTLSTFITIVQFTVRNYVLTTGNILDKRGKF